MHLTTHRSLVKACVAAALVALAASVVIGSASSNSKVNRSAAPSNPLLGPMPTKPLKLTVWDLLDLKGQPTGVAMTKIDKLFMKKYPNIKVVHQGFGYAAYWPTKVVTAVATKKGADVLATYPDPSYTKGLWPMAGLLSASQKKTIGLLADAQAQDPSLHFIPFSTYAYTWAFNKTLFKKAGLNPASPPTTWSQLLSACSALKNAGIQPIAAGFKDGYAGDNFVKYGFISQLLTRSQILQWKSGKIKWTDPTIVAAINYMSQLAKNGCFGSGSDGKLQSDGDTDFAGGNAAMEYSSSLDFNKLATTLGASNLGVFRMPRLPGDKWPLYMDAGPNNNWSILRATKNCRAAWAYISFLEAPQAQAILYNAAGAGQGLPNNTLVKVSSPIPAQEQVIKWSANLDNHGGAFRDDQIEGVSARKLWPEIVAGQLSVNDAANQMQTIANGYNASGATFTKEATPVCN